MVPSGKLPIELPPQTGSQQSSYLAAQLASRSAVSAVDPTPAFPFGHGLSYTTFEYSDLSITPVVDSGVSPAGQPGRVTIGTDGVAEIACTVRNTGDRPGAEVVQLYLRDPVAQIARPVRFLAGFARVDLGVGECRRVAFSVHADRTSFHGVAGTRIVEPGLIEVGVGSSSADLRLTGELDLCGPERHPGPDRVLTTPVRVLER